MSTKKNTEAKVETDMNTNEMNIDEMLDQVDRIIDSLESGDISLEDSFKIYESGMNMIKDISMKIDKVEKKIIELDADKTGEDDET